MHAFWGWKNIFCSELKNISRISVLQVYWHAGDEWINSQLKHIIIDNTYQPTSSITTTFIMYAKFRLKQLYQVYVQIDEDIYPILVTEKDFCTINYIAFFYKPCACSFINICRSFPKYSNLQIEYNLRIFLAPNKAAPNIAS